MVYGELKNFVWYMVNFGKTQWCIMKFPLNKGYDYIFHKYNFFYEYVYNIIDYILIIYKNNSKDIKSRLRKGDA